MKNDTDLELIKRILDRLNMPGVIKGHIISAFEEGYDEISDGCTLSPDLSYGHLFINSRGKFTHPACIFHDYILEKGYYSKWQADKLMYQAMKGFGHTLAAPLFFIGLQTFGWVYHWACLFKKRFLKS